MSDAARQNDGLAVVFHGECADSLADGQPEVRDFLWDILQDKLAFPLAFDFRRQAGDVIRLLFDTVGRTVKFEIGRVACVFHAEFTL